MNLFFANVAYAANTEGVDTFIKSVNKLILNPLISLIFAIALLFFFYGVFEFISKDENDEKRTLGKMHMLWGVVGIVIMLGVWTILNIVVTTIGLDNEKINPETGKVKLDNYTPPTNKVGP